MAMCLMFRSIDESLNITISVNGLSEHMMIENYLVLVG